MLVNLLSLDLWESVWAVNSRKKLLRDDTKDGLVELVFSVDQPAIVEALEKLEVTPDEDGTLLISRRLSPNGRTVNRVNDTTVTITRLKEISSLLIDLHAQHEQQTLLKPAKHLEILDRFGGEDIQKLKKTGAGRLSYLPGT